MRLVDHVTPYVLGAKAASDGRAFVLQYEASLAQAFHDAYYRHYDATRREQVFAEADDDAEHLPRLAAAYEAKLPLVRAILEDTAARYLELFGASLDFPVFCWASLAWTDASVIQWQGADAFALNFRRIVRYDETALRILIAHEVFHVLQMSRHRPVAISDIAQHLWSEGWATYASSVVVPGHPDWRYFSYYACDATEHAAATAALPAVIASLLQDLAISADRTTMRYFSGDPLDTAPFPPRSGYLVGYELARRAHDLWLAPDAFDAQCRAALTTLLEGASR